jgi:hypothetical protein
VPRGGQLCWEWGVNRVVGEACAGTSISDATWDCAVGTATSGNVLEGPIETDRVGDKSIQGTCTEREWADEEERERERERVQAPN